LRDIIAEHGAKTTGFQEIALHIDDQQRALCRDKLERIRLGLNRHRVVHIHNISFRVFPNRAGSASFVPQASGESGVAVATGREATPAPHPTKVAALTAQYDSFVGFFRLSYAPLISQ